ncbi:MAG: tetratricopeptide repeat protein [Anaerolineales bacterium]
MATTHDQARRMNAPRAVALCQCFNGALEFQAGRWDDAEAALQESIELHRQLGAASGEALAWQRLGVLRTARGEYDQAMAALQEGLATAEQAVMRAHCLARLYASMASNRLQAGDHDAAQEALQLGLAMGERHGSCTTCDALLLPIAVKVSLAQDKQQAAEDYCRQLDRAAEDYGSQAWLAMAAEAKGELAKARDDLDLAIEHFGEAQKLFQTAGSRYQAAMTLAALADLRLRASDGKSERQEALQLKSTAINKLEALGAPAPAFLQ